MDKTFLIPSTRNVFRPLIEIMDFIPPFNKLRPQTKDVLAEILAYYHIVYGEYPLPERNNLVFHHDTCVTMANNLGLKLSIFQNNIGMLVKEKIVLKLGYNKNALNEKFLLPLLESITFKFIPHEQSNPVNSKEV